jgi:chromosome segregation ATPase
VCSFHPSQSAADGAILHVDTYLQQWADFTDAACVELDQVAASTLDALAVSFDATCEGLVHDMQRLEAADKDAMNLLSTLTSEMEAVASDINALDASLHQAQKECKEEIHTAKKRALHDAQRSIQSALKATSSKASLAAHLR